MKRYKIFIIGMLVIALLFLGTSNRLTANAAENSLSKPTVKVTSRSATTVKLSITKVKNATGYKIYRATSKDSDYKYVGKTTATSYTDKNLQSTKSYYYKVRAYKTSDRLNTYSKYSNVVSVKKTLEKPSRFTLAATSTTKVKVTFSSVSSAKEYQIYRATSKDGSYKRITTTTKTTYTDSNLTSGTTYYYRVRAVKKVSGVTYYGTFTSTKSVKTKNTTSNQNSNNQSQTASYVDEVVKLINEERAKVGLSKVTTTTALNNAALERAKETVTNFSHTRPNGTSCFTILSEKNISYKACGENIAYGQKSAQAVMNAWMNSSGHRANILSSKFSKVGIGCYQSNGTLYWTQLFIG